MEAVHAEPTVSTTARRRSLVVFTLIATILYAVDQVTKAVAVGALTDRGRVAVLGDLFGFTLTRNPGAAFGAGTSYTVVLSIVAMVAAGVVLWLSRRLADRTWSVALGLLLAGVLGNLTDRVFRDPAPLRGHVVDFLQLPNWPIFNVADICINIAAAVVIVQAFRGVRLDGKIDTKKADA